MKIIERVRAMLASRNSTSDEIKAAIAELGIPAAETGLAQLEAKRTELLLSATDAALTTHDEMIGAARRDIDRKKAANVELEKLLAEAVERERLAGIEARHAEGLAARDRLIAAYAKADQGAVIVAAALGEIREQLEVIRSVNADVVVTAGRRDLKIDSVLAELAAHLGYQSPLRLQHIANWQLPGYWPSADPDGRPLSKVVELSRRAA